MFEKEKKELEIAEKNLREYTLNMVKNIMSKTKEEIVEYATTCYYPSISWIKTEDYSILREDEYFLIKYLKDGKEIGVSIQIEVYNTVLKEFFDMMIEGYSYDKIVERTNKINKFLEVVKE